MVYPLVIQRRLLIASASLLLIFGVLYVKRYTLLSAVGNGLVDEDPPRRVELLVVLSGGGWDRGNEAGRLFREGLAPQLLCTGGNQVPDLLAWGIDITESEITEKNLRRNHIPDSCMVIIREGKSTQEEKEIILRYCKEKGIRDIMLLTSRYHTRRCRKVFSEAFTQQGIRICLRGSVSSLFNETRWWESEEGMIAVNNEWMKHLYYFIKY